VGSLRASVTLAVVSNTVTGGWTGANTYTPDIPVTTTLADYPSNYYSTGPFNYPLGGIHYPYTLATFTVDTTAIYTGSVSTTNVVNTTWFLAGTFSPSSSITNTGMAPATSPGSFLAGVFCGGLVNTVGTSHFANRAALSLTAGTPYSVLVAYAPGATTNTATVTLTGPGVVVFTALSPD